MIQSLPGFREFYPQDCAIRNHIFKIWRQTLNRFGFVEYDGPILEPLELFTEKSGEEIANQLFCFEDKGGRAVALRPEMTPSLVRLVAAKAGGLKKPIKWFSVGEQFRFERPQKGRLRSFYQLNVDILGETHVRADAEAIATLIATLSSFGLTHKDFKIYLSDRTFWSCYLKTWNVSESSLPQVLAVIDKLDRDEPAKTIEKLKTHLEDIDKAHAFLKQVQDLLKVKSIEKLSELMDVLIPDRETNAHLHTRLQEWTSLIEHLKAMGYEDYIEINLGIVRGLAYYTGFVFEAFETSGQSRALAGGGRYDDLMKKLGDYDMPALGYAIGDVTLRDLLESKGLLSQYICRPDIYIVTTGPQEHLTAMADAVSLRNAGFRVEYSLKDIGLSKQLKLANESQAKFALIYGAEEIANKQIKVRDLSSRTELAIQQDHLITTIRDVFQSGLKDFSQD